MNFKKLIQKISKIDFLKKTIFFLIALFIIIAFRKYIRSILLRENFDQKSGFSKKFQVLSNPDDIYDDFYSQIYDKLVYDETKNNYEVNQIIELTKPNANSKILDIGSGTGHHVNLFNKKGFNCLGVDKSKAMVSKANSNFPGINFLNDDFNKSSLFQRNSFSHITCFYFTIYYVKDKAEFFNNCYNWLMPGGYLIIHLANKKLFDPIIPAGNPFLLVSPQSYADERITTSVVKFNNFEYKSNFKMIDGSDKCIMNETFKENDTGHVRKHEHMLYMNSQKEIINIAKENGFVMKKIVDLLKCNHDNQFIYILQKPGSM